tara:strand:- start:171 stop:530 length:360 start_codon:yes stop_codon:yes gene_type:complete
MGWKTGFAIGFAGATAIRKWAESAYPDLKDYTTIEPTSELQGSATGFWTERSDKLRKFVNWHKNYARDYEPTETKLRTEQLEMTEYGLSQNGLVKYIQKNFTKKGKAAVQDMKLKSIEK